MTDIQWQAPMSSMHMTCVPLPLHTDYTKISLKPLFMSTNNHQLPNRQSKKHHFYKLNRPKIHKKKETLHCRRHPIWLTGDISELQFKNTTWMRETGGAKIKITKYNKSSRSLSRVIHVFVAGESNLAFKWNYSTQTFTSEQIRFMCSDGLITYCY